MSRTARSCSLTRLRTAAAGGRLRSRANVWTSCHSSAGNVKLRGGFRRGLRVAALFRAIGPSVVGRNIAVARNGFRTAGA